MDISGNVVVNDLDLCLGLGPLVVVVVTMKGRTVLCQAWRSSSDEILRRIMVDKPGKSPSRTRWRLLGVGREVLDYIRRAQGLAYLHPDCVPPIIHKDIKANNILIGLDFKPYIADLGLSKLLDDGGFGWSSNTVASPYGYIAPREFTFSNKKNTCSRSILSRTHAKLD
ncbi:receptor kinase 2 [Olea europaea subsp. europaea]|uniref:non-specific serine/threonine protein kinase n=1 Tax=Olea europaea subsp. europaea TaxID=158383 RepID=A0A8S0SDH5_OLEEU|nr:receptor kinase 2 [Olea europaea subsp. europaea]